MNKFLHIYIEAEKNISTDFIEKKMNLALDWYRYSENVYLVYTSNSSEKWKERLVNLVENGGRLFICELNIESRKGLMEKDFWKFIRDNSAKSKIDKLNEL